MSDEQEVVFSALLELADALNSIRGFMESMDRRVEALEKRIYKVEDVCLEILRRGTGERSLVQAADRAADSQPVSSDSHT